MFTIRKAALAAAALALLAPLVAAAVPAQAAGSVSYQKYSWSSAIYAIGQGSPRQLTVAEWVGLGSPKPQVVSWIEDSRVLRYPSNPSELFLEEPGLKAPRHHLSAMEWAGTGHAPNVDLDHSFSGYTWNENILMVGRAIPPMRIDETVWNEFGRPTPQLQATNAGDQFCQTPADNAVYWSNPAAGLSGRVHLTLEQYTRAGNPAFTPC